MQPKRLGLIKGPDVYWLAIKSLLLYCVQVLPCRLYSRCGLSKKTKKLFILDLDWSLLAVYWAWTTAWKIWYMTISIFTSRGKCLD